MPEEKTQKIEISGLDCLVQALNKNTESHKEVAQFSAADDYKNLTKEVEALKGTLQDLVKEVRGLGLMLAVELYDESLAKRIVQEGLKKGFLLNQTAKTVLRFVPPLIISKTEIDSLISFLDPYFLE